MLNKSLASNKSVTGEMLELIGRGVADGKSNATIAQEVGLKPHRVANILRWSGVRRGNDKVSSRFPTRKGSSGALELAVDHPAVVEGRTLFPTTVRDCSESDSAHPNVLIDGVNNAKLGSVVTYGRFKGYRIFHLSLEERATCPTSCGQWRTCYGNRMHRAARHKPGAALESRIIKNVLTLTQRHEGVLVRLHTLGDFYSSLYVDVWGELVEKHPNLAVFGYTSRDGEIYDTIMHWMGQLGWERWAIRKSGKLSEFGSAVLKGESGSPTIGDGFICKSEWAAKQEENMNCGQCAACWESTKPVIFEEH